MNNKRIHFIAIGGAAMHQLAIALHLNGYVISGSDDEIFDPALSNLKKHGLIKDDYFWNPEKITSDIDLVILGMHARCDNPELIKAQELGLRILSFPEYIYQRSQNKQRVVIGGSHGKTTITSMIMHVLRDCGRPFDYLVGSSIPGFDVMVSLDDQNDLIVIEGDEYLSSCLLPRPKFHSYHPHIAVISGIEWDHINVFPTFEDYSNAFSVFASMVPEGGSVIWCADDENISQIMQSGATQATSVPYKPVQSELKDGKLHVHYNNTPVPVKVFGEHNMKNMSAAFEVCSRLGISAESFFASIASFSGAGRRLECIHDEQGIRIFRDFAHAPSKLKATVNAVRNRYPNEMLLAVFELHTFSSMNKAFLPHYQRCMEEADVAAVYFSPHAFQLKRLETLSSDEIREGFSRPDIEVLSDQQSLISFIADESKIPVNILLMSSGNFDKTDFRDIVHLLHKKN